mmetsp:Transcript_23586/g.70853  ORF Transcript_23586/g.70853 Transcript_23586/m.70853 type:complete len:245 (-) Transcript_23586:408-1142(-)
MDYRWGCRRRGVRGPHDLVQELRVAHDLGEHLRLCHRPVSVHRLWLVLEAVGEVSRVRGRLGRLPAVGLLPRLLDGVRPEPADLALPGLPAGPEVLLRSPPRPDPLGADQLVERGRDVHGVQGHPRGGDVRGGRRSGAYPPRDSDHLLRAPVLHLRLLLERAGHPDDHGHPARAFRLHAHVGRLRLPALDVHELVHAVPGGRRAAVRRRLEGRPVLRRDVGLRHGALPAHQHREAQLSHPRGRQ